MRWSMFSVCVTTFGLGPVARDRATASRSIYSRGTIARLRTRKFNCRKAASLRPQDPRFGGIDGVGQETTWYVP
jgi:hypothetical protein